MADALYGGLATSAFPSGPTTLATAGNAFQWRPKPGRSPSVAYVPVLASAVILHGDILNRTAVTAGFERAVDPVGTTATATVTGDVTLATAPLYMALHDYTASATVDDLSKIAVYSLDDVQLLFRLYHATAATSGGDNVAIGTWDYEASTLYEWGIYEMGTSSTNYFPIVDVANQDSDDGTVRVVELATEYGIDTNFGMAWCEFDVSNLA